MGVGKGLCWRRIELQASELEQCSPLSVQDRCAGQKVCWDHCVRAVRYGNGGSYNRQIHSGTGHEGMVNELLSQGRM